MSKCVLFKDALTHFFHSTENHLSLNLVTFRFPHDLSPHMLLSEIKIKTMSSLTHKKLWTHSFHLGIQFKIVRIFAGFELDNN